MTQQKSSTAQAQRLVLLASTLVVTAWVAHILIRGMYLSGNPLRLAVTSVLVVGFVLFVVAEVWLAMNLDEFHRQVQLMALAMAFPASLVAAFAFGFLRGEGFFLNADPRDLPAVMVLLYAAGYVLAWRRYQ